ncbi:LysR family transcriptional regulator [Aquabacterium sp.]|uniref:LysR family transcriptional regulator n=1 Tax=Aquabacterium sp. TaxID=1872578 RepID=UPI0035AE0627
MNQSFNYRHLYYFWVVAHEGGIARGAERLGMAVQTVSAQVRELERALGCALLKPAGRGVVLTEAGQAALRQADQIFQLGEQLPGLVRDAGQRPGVRLAVGVFDGLPKLAVQRLLEPVLAEPQLRLLCHVDEYERLMADLVLHRLDVVLADRAAPAQPTMKVYSHRLGESVLAWWAPPVWAEAAERGFPQSLASVPVLLPTAHAAVRARIDQWFDKIGVRPMVVGEFEDSALLKTFGAGGMGVFPAAELVSDLLTSRYGVRQVGRSDEVAEHFYAIAAEKKVAHPLVQRLLPAAR